METAERRGDARVGLSGHCDSVLSDRLVGLVVKASVSRTADSWFDSRLCCGDFSRSIHTGDLTIVTPVAALPGALCYRVSAGTGVIRCEYTVTG